MMRAVPKLIPAGTVGDAAISTDGGEYLTPAVRNGARGLAVLRKFFSFSVVSLFVNCTN